MIQLSGFPSGLLDLVGAQNFGINPKAMSDVIAPTMELLELFLVTKQRIELVGAPTFVVANGANTANSFLVPTGEVWRVSGFSGGVQTAAGENVSFTPIVTVNGISLGLAPTINQGASLYQFMVANNLPIWIPPGARLGILATGVAGAPAASMTALVARLRI